MLTAVQLLHIDFSAAVKGASGALQKGQWLSFSHQVSALALLASSRRAKQVRSVHFESAPADGRVLVPDCTCLVYACSGSDGNSVVLKLNGVSTMLLASSFELSLPCQS